MLRYDQNTSCGCSHLSLLWACMNHEPTCRRLAVNSAVPTSDVLIVRLNESMTKYVANAFSNRFLSILSICCCTPTVFYLGVSLNTPHFHGSNSPYEISRLFGRQRYPCKDKIKNTCKEKKGSCWPRQGQRTRATSLTAFTYATVKVKSSRTTVCQHGAL